MQLRLLNSHILSILIRSFKWILLVLKHAYLFADLLPEAFFLKPHENLKRFVRLNKYSSNFLAGYNCFLLDLQNLAAVLRCHYR